MSSEEIVGGKSVFLYLKGEDVLGGITQFFPYTKTLKSSTDSESTWKSPGIFLGPMGRNLVVGFKTNSKVTPCPVFHHSFPNYFLTDLERVQKRALACIILMPKHLVSPD